MPEIVAFQVCFLPCVFLSKVFLQLPGYSHSFTGYVYVLLENEQKLWCIPLTTLHACITSLWLFWSCCCKGRPNHGPPMNPRGPCGKWHYKDQREVLSAQHCPCGITVVVHVNQGGSLRPETVSLPLPTLMLHRCVLMMWGKLDFKHISRFALEIQEMYPRFVAWFRGLYTSQWCRQDLFASSHKFLHSHHILNASQFLRVQSFMEIIIFNAVCGHEL